MPVKTNGGFFSDPGPGDLLNSLSLLSLDGAYAKLGLEPLDTFMLRQAALENPPTYRQIGTSTWMCVSAAINVIQSTLSDFTTRKDALIVGDSSKEGERLWKETISILRVMGYEKRDMQDSIGWATYGRVNLGWASAPRDSAVCGRVGFSGRIFQDSAWKDRAIRRCCGPFAMIRVIKRMPDGSYHAFAEDGEELMELFFEGVENLCKQHPEIGTIGFRVRGSSSFYSKLLAADIVVPTPPVNLHTGALLAAHPPFAGDLSKRWDPDDT